VLIQRGGTSFLLGLLLGDVTGGGVAIFIGRTLVDSAYSRDAERAADGFAADRMVELGRPPRALGDFLKRVANDSAVKGISIVLSHPLTDERLAQLSKMQAATTGAPLLGDAEWQALRSICKA
jgi:predicted Zn-dependent protease